MHNTVHEKTLQWYLYLCGWQAHNQGGSRGLDEPPILTSFLLESAINTQQ